ncbi:MAG: BatD family protein [Verrucomicrobiota bacterium]|nr:BatD family protein [Verrucomicrobiota bacterium]
MAAATWAVDVSFDVQPRLLNVGETAKATLIFHGTNKAPPLAFPDIDGLQISTASQLTQNINGHVSVHLTYRLFPQRAGTFTLSPYTLEYNGEELHLPAVSLEVRVPQGVEASSTNQMLFARVSLPQTAPYIHQPFDMLLSIYSLPSIQLTRDVQLLGGLPESGFALSSFEELQTIREEVNGQIYTLRRFRARARALTTGHFTIQPILRVNVVDASQPQRRREAFGGFFDDPFFSSGPAATPVNLDVPPAPLDIRPIPVEGRPADFTGAVGEFQFQADVRPREVKAGEPITVTLRLQGRGNIASARSPVFPESTLYKTYDPRQVGDSPSPSDETGTKTMEQVILPRSEALTELPSLSFSYFDPALSQYRTLSVGPFPLTVHPADNANNALLLQIPGSTAEGGSKAIVLGSDIVYLKPAPKHWKNPAASKRLFTPAFLLVHALSPIGLAVLYGIHRRRNRLAEDIAFARRRHAPKSARASLRRAADALRQAPSPSSVFEPLSAAVADYFGHRLNLPPGAVESGLILEKLQQAGLPEIDLARWREFFALCEQIRYAEAPSLDPAALDGWINTLTTLLRQTERIKL